MAERGIYSLRKQRPMLLVKMRRLLMCLDYGEPFGLAAFVKERSFISRVTT